MNPSEARKIANDQDRWDQYQSKTQAYTGGFARRIFSYAYPDDSGCWVWTGGIQSKGYGVTSLNQTPWLAHRAAWFVANGDIPANLLVLHRCDNRKCINPEHLFLGTNRDNMVDASNKGRLTRKATPVETSRARARLLLLAGGAQ